MACNQTLTNLNRTCEDRNNKGGLYTEVIVAEWDKVTLTWTDGAITAITLDPLASWYTYQFAKGAAIFDSEYTFDSETGDKQFCTNTLTINFKKQDASKRTSLIGLCNSEVFILVKDANGVWHVMGSEEYAGCTAATSTTGQARTDVNQYVVTISDTSADYAPIVSQTIVDNAINPPAPDPEEPVE